MNNQTKRYLELAQQIQTEFTDIDGVNVWVNCYGDFVGVTFMSERGAQEASYSYSYHEDAINELKALAESLK